EVSPTRAIDGHTQVVAAHFVQLGVVAAHGAIDHRIEQAGHPRPRRATCRTEHSRTWDGGELVVPRATVGCLNAVRTCHHTRQHKVVVVVLRVAQRERRSWTHAHRRAATTDDLMACGRRLAAYLGQTRRLHRGLRVRTILHPTARGGLALDG